MDEKGTLYEAFAIVEPTEKVKLRPRLIIKNRVLLALTFLLFIFITTFFLVVFFSTINVIVVLKDQLGHRLKVMIEPLGILILGVVDQLNTDFGSHASKIVGLCSIVILIALIWAGRVTRRGASKAVCVFLSLVAIFVFAGAACEFYLVLDFGPSKLRNKMLSILGYEVGGFYLFLASGFANKIDDYYKKEQAVGRPVPWFFSAIIRGITIVTAFIEKSMQVIVLNFVYFEISCFPVIIISNTFVDESYSQEHTYFVLAIGCAILAFVIILILASARPSYTDLEAVMRRDMFIYGVSTTFLCFALLTSGLIGKVVVQTTKYPADYTSTVCKSIVVCVFITTLCICKCFKVTPTSLSDFVVRSRAMIYARLCCTPAAAPAAETELDTLLTDTDCESESSNQNDEQLYNITAHKKTWGLAGCTATATATATAKATTTAITGTARDNASYTLLSDTESGEISIRSSEKRTECI